MGLPVSRTSLRYYLRLPVGVDLTIQDISNFTGLSKRFLKVYIDGDWTSAGIISKHSVGASIYYRRTVDVSTYEELMKMLSRNARVELIGNFDTKLKEPIIRKV